MIAWKGGSPTKAGVRRTKEALRKDWTCPTCGATLRYYWARCPNDGTQRPE